MAYVCMTIMRMYPGYTMDRLLGLPFCHVLALYHWAEKAVSMFRYDVLIGEASLRDEQLAKGLSRVAQSATIPDREKMRELTSKQNIDAVRKRAKEMRVIHA